MTCFLLHEWLVFLTAFGVSDAGSAASEPVWYRNLSILIPGILLVGIVLFYWYRMRVNRVVRQKQILERQIRERTARIIAQKEEIERQKALLEKEKEKTEKLLRNVLPDETARDLRDSGKTAARSYNMASVMFTDFKGFTRIAEKLRPKDLVEQLDLCFGAFDDIIGKYNLEKIKTIGDSYMCAGGVPVRNKTNAIDMVLAALEIQRFINSFNEQNTFPDVKWDLRIGINTGELIAGVVGSKRFAFDVWGDTVNIANRLETACEPGRINVSNSTYQIIKDFFVCTKRGKLPVKHKGYIDMFFVDAIKPELSINGDGLMPNDVFYERVTTLLSDKFNFRKSEQRVLKLLTEQLPDGLYYHGIHHTLDVTQAAEEIAKAEGVDGEDLFLLKTAALFHDAGFIEEYTRNEHLGVKMARDVLPNYGFTERQLNIIEGLILATQIPQTPKNHLEMIMCDADLDYLGRDDFHEISETLKQELMMFNKVANDRQWDQMQISFLESHQYWTKTNQSRRDNGKVRRIEEIKRRLIENNYTD